MTSANVYYIDFREIPTIKYDRGDRSTWVQPKLLHQESIHIMCKEKLDWDKILSLPLDSTEIYIWGYDEEDEEWSCQDVEWDEEGNREDPEPLKTLRQWIDDRAKTSKSLREKLIEANISV